MILLTTLLVCFFLLLCTISAQWGITQAQPIIGTVTTATTNSTTTTSRIQNDNDDGNNNNSGKLNTATVSRNIAKYNIDNDYRPGPLQCARGYVLVNKLCLPVITKIVRVTQTKVRSTTITSRITSTSVTTLTRSIPSTLAISSTTTITSTATSTITASPLTVTATATMTRDTTLTETVERYMACDCPILASYPCIESEGVCVTNCDPSLQFCNGQCAYNYRSSGIVCFASQGPCQEDAICTGSSPFCPLPAYKNNTIMCMAANGPCALDSYCDGVQAPCIPSYQPDTYVCETALCGSTFCTGDSSLCANVVC